MKLKKKKSIKNRLLMLFILIILFSLIMVYYISNKVMPSLLIYTENIVKEEGITLVSENITDKVINILDKEDLFYIDKDNEGNIESIDYNSKVVNEIIKESSEVVQDNFNKYKTENNNIIA